jgi:NodT family efflux transporter outer membrane factor (OMF) lipoprotein
MNASGESGISDGARLRSATATVVPRTLALVAGLLLAACVTPPKVSPLDKPIDQRGDLGLSSAAAPVQSAWWTAYRDPQLDRLIHAALADNPTLGEALSRLRQAQAVVDATAAQLWPYVSYDGSSTREKISGKAPIPSQYQGASLWLSDELVNFSWALDFWGRQASLVRQARSREEAAALDAAAARLAIVGAVVRSYIDLERAYELTDVARREEEQRGQILAITQRRFRAGLDTNVELRQAAGAVPEARVERLADEAVIDRDVHLLAALAGRGAGEYGHIRRPTLRTETALALPSELPMDLLARRPDVLAARSRIGAAQAGLAVAKADFYPNINLLAFGGTTAAGPFRNLFQGRAATYGVGPAFDLPLFDAGRLKANYRANVADIDVAVTAYNRTVLTAVRQTADQLSDLKSLDVSLIQQRQSLEDAQTAFHLATERYRAGLTTYLTVLATETEVFDAQRQEVNLESARASARVNLLIDVGGDFRPDSPAVAFNLGR